MTKPSDNSAVERTALFVTPEAPYPIYGGGAQRIACLMEYVCRRYSTDAIVFRQPTAADPRTVFPPGLMRDVQVIELPVHSKSTAARARRSLFRLLRGVPPLVDRFSGFEKEVAAALQGKRYDLCVVEHFWCATYQRILEQHCRRIVLDLHNIESELHRRSALGESGLVSVAHSRFATLAARMELEWMPRYPEMLATSETDAVHARRIAPQSAVYVMPNAIPSAPVPNAEPKNLIVFSGNLEYHPNRAAVRYFRHEIWPALREQFPELRWRLIGMNSHAVATDVAGDARIETTGSVADALPLLAEGRVAVVPLLAGSGTRIKILEAWAAGIPVVSTPIGAEGLQARHGEHLLLADSAALFRQAVADLLTTPELHRRIAAGGRAFYESHFTWESAWNALHRAGI